MTRLSDVAMMAGGRLLGDDVEVTGISIDTRTLRRGELFVALSGERFDGHRFVLRAASLGSAACLVSQHVEGAPALIVVEDTLAALQRFAGEWRVRFEMPVVSVTGSNGKTTTKQMLAEVLSPLGSVLATGGNYNNHIGVPLTLLRLRPEHRAAVIEIGANHIGEVAPMASLTQAKVTVITCSGEDHLEGFGSVEASARTNGESITHARTDAVVVIPNEDEQSALWRDLANGRKVVTFGFESTAKVRAEAVEESAEECAFTLVTPVGSAWVRLKLAGRHNINNALASAAAALELGVPLDAIAARLSAMRAVSGRGCWLTATNGARVFDDSYNANPSSVRAALEVLSRCPSPRYAVLGDMAELGDEAPAMHREIGVRARDLGIEHLLTLGPLSAHTAEGFGAGARHCSDFAALKNELALIGGAASVLVKGSRSSRMERVVAVMTGSAVGGVH